MSAMLRSTRWDGLMCAVCCIRCCAMPETRHDRALLL